MALFSALLSGHVGQTYKLLEKACGTTITNKLPPLPRIVVIGSECSGKSSLLNNLVGARLFPTGREQSTRCAVLLRLGPAIREGQETYAVGLDGGQLEEFFDVDRARERIEALMPQGRIDRDKRIVVAINKVCGR